MWKEEEKRLISLILCVAMVLSMMPVMVFAQTAAQDEVSGWDVSYDEPDTPDWDVSYDEPDLPEENASKATVYCKTSARWTVCKAYWWGSADTNPNWPGVDMEQDENGIWTIDIPSDAIGLIFNNGSGSQTQNLTVPTDSNNMYTYNTASWDPYDATPLEDVYYVAGSFNGWMNPDPAYKMVKQDDGTYALTLTLTAGSYELKVTDGTWDNTWGESGTSGNYKFSSPEDGEYVVTFQVENLTVGIDDGLPPPTPPLPMYVSVVGDEALTGVEWEPSDESTIMAQEGDVYTLTFTNVAAGEYAFKFAANGTWDVQWASGDVMVSGEIYTAWFAPKGNSRVIVAEDNSTITLTLDLTNMDPSTGEGGYYQRIDRGSRCSPLCRHRICHHQQSGHGQCRHHHRADR